MEERMENKQEVKGYRIVDQEVKKDQLTEGSYYFNGRIGEKPIKILKKSSNDVRCEIWNDYQSKFKIFHCDYDGFYTKIQVPVYE